MRKGEDAPACVKERSREMGIRMCVREMAVVLGIKRQRGSGEARLREKWALVAGPGGRTSCGNGWAWWEAQVASGWALLSLSLNSL